MNTTSSRYKATKIIVATAVLIAALQCMTDTDRAWAQPKSSAAPYPVKPVRLVVGQAPGGATDIVARAIAQKLSENLGQSFVVDNRTGAAGSIGAALVAKSPPDGYTLFIASSSYSINPGLYAELPFDPMKDMAPIMLLAEAPFLLVVNPVLPARTVKDLIALAKARPGMLNFSSGGTGSSGHLAGELFQNLAGISMIHVPYKGAAPATVDVIAGQIHLTFASMVSGLPHVKSGKLRALGVTSARRSPAMPELPAIAESGVPGYHTSTWYGALAPASVTPEIIGKLNSELARTLKLPDMKERMSSEGAEPVGSSPAEFGKFLASEIVRWRRVIKNAGIKVD